MTQAAIPQPTTGPRTALFALFFLLVVTAGWWALALWPAGDVPAEWLIRARVVCFNAGDDGLPDASGWLLLVGQPIGMLSVLLLVWGDQVRVGLTQATRSSVGLASVLGCVTLLAVGLAASGVRVFSPAPDDSGFFDASGPLPDTYPRLDRAAPPLSLIDQHGNTLTLDVLRGRPALVTFAFGHCETVCPAIVKQVVTAQQQMGARAARGEIDAEAVPRVVIVSLDPWRDTPSRLAHLGAHWELPEDAHVLTGEVEQVEAVLDAWNVARSRDPNTGDVTHPSLVFILDAEGSIAFASRGETAAVLELLGRV